jgi:hypothetical protein
MSRTYAHTPTKHRHNEHTFKNVSDKCPCYLCHDNAKEKSNRRERKGELFEQDFNNLINNLTRSTRNLSELLESYDYEN